MMTSTVSTAKITMSTMSSSASRQFISTVIGSSTIRMMKVERCSRKKASQMPNRLSMPCSMILSSRPEWVWA